MFAGPALIMQLLLVELKGRVCRRDNPKVDRLNRPEPAPLYYLIHTGCIVKELAAISRL